uniref:Uncharacterized protein n=1 Tax=Arundo donax TaxID=35708 RepID=A0A0A9HK28_ARUDO
MMLFCSNDLLSFHELLIIYHGFTFGCITSLELPDSEKMALRQAFPFCR